MTRRIPDDAFEYYVGLGPGRSYQAVADKYDVTKRAVTKHATQKEWSRRLESLEREAQEKSDKKLGESLEEIRERHLRTLRAMHARALTALKQYPLTSGMEAMRAAEMAIKLERLVVGEASERSAVSVEEVTRNELSRWLVTPNGNDEGDEGS